MNWTIILLVGALLPGIVVGQGLPDGISEAVWSNISATLGNISMTLGSLSTATTQNISNFIGMQGAVIGRGITNVTEEINKLPGQVQTINRQLVNNVTKQLEGAVSNIAEIVNILSFGVLRNLRGFPDSTPTESERVVLLEALNTFQNILTRMTLENIRPLLDRYNDWAGSGLISGIATILIEPRQKLVNAIGKPTSVLCGVKSDTSGKLLPAQANTTLALNGIRSTAQSVVDDCKGLSCLLLVPGAQQVVRDCNC